MKKRIKLAITPAVEEFAKMHGAYFDDTENAWCVDDVVPPELDEFVVRDVRTRQFQALVAPRCALCSSNMNLKSNQSGRKFWSCSGFPSCKGKKLFDAGSFVHISELPAPCKSPIATIKASTKKAMPSDVRKRVGKIIARAEVLFGHPGATWRWLTLPKITLNHKTPLDTMIDLVGCKKVEKLLIDCFK